MVMDIRKWDIKVNRCQDFIENFLFMCIFMVGFWVQFFTKQKNVCLLYNDRQTNAITSRDSGEANNK